MATWSSRARFWSVGGRPRYRGPARARKVLGLVEGETFTLTTSLDNLTGGAGPDTFNGLDTSSATTQTLTSGDSLTGGAGTDTLNITVSGGGAINAPSFFTNGIEVLNVTNNNSGTYTVDAALLAGLTTVRATAGANPLTVQNQTAILNAELVSANQNLTLTPAASAVSGTADSMTVTLNSAGTTASPTITQNGIETINVVLSGSASGSAANATRVVVASNALDNVVVTGTVGARLTANFVGAAGTDVARFDASAATGGVDADITLGASTIANISGGSGNDTFILGTLQRLITIAGGAGTDTLQVNTVGAYSSTATPSQPGANVSGFEVLALANSGTADIRQFTNNSGFTTLEAAGATATFGGVGTSAITLNAKATGGTVTMTRATDAATGDTATVNLAATTPGTYTAVSIADEEVVTLSSGGTSIGTNVITTLTATDLTSLTVTGSNALTVTTLTGAAALATLNAGAHTGSTFAIDASASGVAMTVTASAGSEATVGAQVNNITTGSGNDSITGGSFYDSLTGGVGNDTINGGGGNDTLRGNANNDVIDGGDGDDLVDGDVGNDSLTGGNGNDTIQAASGSDTVSGGAGNDAIYVSTLNDDDSIDGGANTDTLSLSAPTLIGAGATAAQYTDVTDSTVARITGVETAYIQVTTTGSNTTAAQALTLDMTNVTGMTTLWLDVNDGTNNGDEFIVIKNFGGSTINLTGLASATDSNPESLTLDGIGQAALTVNVRSYATATTEATVFTGVEAVTVSGTSQINSANVTNTLGNVTAASASSITARTSGSTVVAPNAGALTINTLTAGNANTVALNAGSYDSLIVTTNVVADQGLVQTLDIDAGTGSTLNIDGGLINLAGSTVRTATIDLLADGNLFDNADGATVDINATTIVSLTANIGANAKAGFDLNASVTGGTVTLSSGSKWNVNTIGGAGATSVTVTGTGDVDSGTTGAVIAPSIALSGTTVVFNAGGLTDADSLSVSSTATTSSTITAPLSTAGAEISSGAGADSLTGGAGADRFGLTGRVETITIAQGNDGAVDTINLTFNGVPTGAIAAAADGLTKNADTAALLVAAINATSATSFVTATNVGAVITVTYAQYFGVAGAVGAEVDADNDSTQTFAVTTAGDNAGADSISAGLGQDTVLAGSGIDAITITDTTNERDSIRFTATPGSTNYDVITGFDAGGAGTDDLLLLGNSIYAFVGADGAGNGGTVAVATGATLAAAETADDDFTVATISTNIGVLYSGFTAATPTVTYADLKAAVVAALGNPASIADAAEVLVLIDDGVSTGIWKLSADATTNTTVAAELELVGILSGVADATLVVANNFGFSG